MAAAIETESDPLFPRGAGRKVRRLPGGGGGSPSYRGTGRRLHRSVEEAINVVADPLGAVSAKEQSAAAIGKHEQCAMVGLGPAELAYAFAVMKPLNGLNRIHLQVP